MPASEYTSPEQTWIAKKIATFSRNATSHTKISSFEDRLKGV